MSERLELADEAGYASLAVNPSVVVIGAEIAAEPVKTFETRGGIFFCQ